MEPLPQIDINDVITREKLFLEHAQAFLSTIKLNLPPADSEKIRSEEEILACNKVRDEREEGRKMKEKERKIRESKYKKKVNRVNMSEFVGNQEFDKIKKDEEVDVEEKNNKRSKRNRIEDVSERNNSEIKKRKTSYSKDKGSITKGKLHKDNEEKQFANKNKSQKYNKSTFIKKQYNNDNKRGGSYSKKSYGDNNKNYGGAKKFEKKRLGKSRRAEIKNKKQAKK
ncbi:hypothetical protein COBT_000633 [Conglomerata obtusa]